MTAYPEAFAAVQDVWDTYWTPVTGVPVLWHMNTNDQVPSVGTTTHWLHLSVNFIEEGIRAFGGGVGRNDQALTGSVVIRVLAERGHGEVTSLALLDAAMTVFRSRRVGTLSFIGKAISPQPGASEDGNWWVRSGIAAFEYRFQG